MRRSVGRPGKALPPTNLVRVRGPNECWALAALPLSSNLPATSAAFRLEAAVCSGEPTVRLRFEEEIVGDSVSRSGQLPALCGPDRVKHLAADRGQIVGFTLQLLDACSRLPLILGLLYMQLPQSLIQSNSSALSCSVSISTHDYQIST